MLVGFVILAYLIFILIISIFDRSPDPNIRKLRSESAVFILAVIALGVVKFWLGILR
jgi:hypothetical protein